ncbi:MAG: hypothetical protein RML38_10885, partial [Bacteroidia bacterium]|nr:hypothetical protein [Bacteroidia bacterium]
MINSAVGAYYRSQIFIKVFLFGLLVILASTFFTWIKLEGLFAIFAGNEMKKFIAGIKSITVVACVLSLLWLVAGLFLNEKKIQWFSISSVPLVILFFYMAYNSFVDKESTAENKIYTMTFFISCGLLYVIPMILAIRNNFKSVFLNINFTLFILLLILLYVIDKFGASAMKTLG